MCRRDDHPPHDDPPVDPEDRRLDELVADRTRQDPENAAVWAEIADNLRALRG